MEIRFLEIAQMELEKAVEYYTSESPGLGDLFLVEIISTLERIRRYPEGWHPFTRNTHRCQTRRFPYGVIYQILGSGILIVAVAHLHREPEYWRHRI